jgi:hypothetical protein
VQLICHILTCYQTNTPINDHRFGDEQVTGSEWQSNPPDPTAISAYWSSSAYWMSGANNSPSPEQYTSSYGCLDALVRAVVNKNVFPNVNWVVVTGFSAGGQTTISYSWATSVDANSTAEHWHMRYIPSDPGSFLYLNSSRPNASCYPSDNTGVDHTCSVFLTQNATFNCSGYNDWKFGLGGFTSSGFNYLNPFIANPAAIASQTALMRVKDVRYIFGAFDYCNCNLQGFINEPTCYPGKQYFCNPDAYGGKHCCDSFPDSTTVNALTDDCSSNLQGSNRLQRGLIYMSYLKMFWSDHNYQPLHAIVPDMRHNSTQFFLSSQFALWAFEGGPSMIPTHIPTKVPDVPTHIPTHRTSLQMPPQWLRRLRK